MLSLITGLSSKVYLFVIAALGTLLLSAAAYNYYLSSENDDLKADLKSYELALDASVKISNENEKEFADYKERSEVIINTLEADHEQELKRYKSILKKKLELKNVKKDDDGVNANVLNGTLDWLRQQTISSNANQTNKSGSTK